MGKTYIVAALYVDPRGPYPKMPGVDCWDEQRDARLYAGPYPVVAHPPCGPWGRLRHLYRGNEHDCAPAAVEAVRRWGGVLEHPAWSLIWPACRMPRPGELPDEFGGFSVGVDQVAWGHVARKRTWLYVVGVSPIRIAPRIHVGVRPTHWVSGRTGRARELGLRRCSAQQARRTPPEFAAWLVELARSASQRSEAA